MTVEKYRSQHGTALIFTEDDKFLVTVDAIVGNLVSNTIAVQSLLSPDNRWRSDILEGGRVVAIVDVSSVQKAEKDVDQAMALVPDPAIVLVVRKSAGPLGSLQSRAQTILPLDKLEDMLHSVLLVVRAGMCVAPAPILRSNTEQSLPLGTDPDLERLDNLSPRENRVLLGLLDGLSNKQIARLISISDNTVRVHIRNIFLKLGVANRTQAALLATRCNYTGVSHERIASTSPGRFHSHAHPV